MRNSAGELKKFSRLLRVISGVLFLYCVSPEAPAFTQRPAVFMPSKSGFAALRGASAERADFLQAGSPRGVPDPLKQEQMRRRR